MLCAACVRACVMLQATDLKKRIESLIEREYMAREANDPNVSGQGPGPEGQATSLG